jgi:tetratricopeptide (TPR) repeat protein
MKTSLLVVVTAALLAGCSSPAPSAKTEQTAAPATAISRTSKSPEAVAHLQKGETLLDNLRITEAADEFSQALKLDPDFVLARAYHGQATPGPDGLKELESAKQAAGSLPEAERVLIDAMVASRRGDAAETRTALTRLTELVPGDWRGHYLLGQQLVSEQKYNDAVPALKKATSLNANAGAAQNMLGYAAFRQGDVDGAIAAFTEYARIMPQEPNPQDSLGEALMGAGRFKESEAAYGKALELSPQFWNAHQGIAYSRFYAGDWAGGRDALAKAKAAATRRVDKIAVDEEIALAALSQRKTAEALRLLDQAEKTEGAQPSEVAFFPIDRAIAFIDAGRPRDASAPLAAALKAADSGELPPGLSRNLRRAALRARLTEEAQMKDAAAAQKTSAALDQDASSRPDDQGAQSAMHFGKGQLAIAQADIKGARAHFDQCSREDEMCKWQGVVAAEKAGDKAGAASLREQLLKVYQRDPGHLMIRSRLTPRRSTT